MTRISLAGVVTLLQSALPTGTYVGSSYERTYWTDSGKKFPGVWVGGQQVDAIDRGDRYTGVIRQSCRVRFGVRVIVARAAAGVIDAEGDLADLCDDVESALLGHTLADAERPLVLVSQADESPQETVLSALLIFETTLTWQVPE